MLPSRAPQRCLARAPAVQARPVLAAPKAQFAHSTRRALPVARAAAAADDEDGEDTLIPDYVEEKDIVVTDEMVFDNDDIFGDEGRGRGRGGRGRGRGDGEEGDDRGERGERKEDDGFEDRIIQLNRVTKVLKGGKLMRFRAVVVVGDKKGRVGMGIASAREVVDAVSRATTKAKQSCIVVPVTPARSFPHQIQIKDGATRVMLRPASPGTGVIAGGSVRVVLELAGYQNAFGKIYGSASALNNARGTLTALSQMRTWKEVAKIRGVTMDYAMGRVSEPDAIAAR